MKTQPITEFNKDELMNVSRLIQFSQYSSTPVVKHTTFQDFACIGHTINCLLSAIEIIGFTGNKEDLAICGGLAEIAKKLLPSDELEFLDKLLVEKEYLGEKRIFTPLQNLQQ